MVTTKKFTKIFLIMALFFMTSTDLNLSRIDANNISTHSESLKYLCRKLQGFKGISLTKTQKY
jgi:hypothetical protein